MAFITNFNHNQILNSYFINNTFSSNRELFDKPIMIFNLLEKNKLLLYQLLLESKGNLSQYPESNQLKFQRKLPQFAAYHYYKDCKKLNSSYTISTIEKINDNEEIINHSEKKNSGVFYWDLKKELSFYEQEINKILKVIEDITNSDSIIRSYATQTYLLNGDLDKLRAKGLNDLAIEQLKQFEQHFKIPLTQALIDYYEAKFNPDIDFEEIYLQSLGFKTCNECFTKKKVESMGTLKEIIQKSFMSRK